jgi:acetolactate decarboxylase
MIRCLALLLCCAAPALARDLPARDTLYQVSTLDALLAGIYAPAVPVAEVARHGDLGLGTFEALDGEMVVLGGRVYQARADGSVRVAPARLGVPFAQVTFFEPDQRVSRINAGSLEDLCAALDRALPSANVFYALHARGRFAAVKVRSVPAQAKPYPGLGEAVKSQKVFELRDVDGDLVGFRSPASARGEGVPGWHIHFLSADRRQGGHVLALSAAGLSADLDLTPALALTLPDTPDFRQADLSGGRDAELRKAESDPAKKQE